MEKEIKLKFTILFYVELTIVKNADCINFFIKIKNCDSMRIEEHYR